MNKKCPDCGKSMVPCTTRTTTALGSSVTRYWSCKCGKQVSASLKEYHLFPSPGV